MAYALGTPSFKQNGNQTHTKYKLHAPHSHQVWIVQQLNHCGSGRAVPRGEAGLRSVTVVALKVVADLNSTPQMASLVGSYKIVEWVGGICVVDPF